MNELRRQHHAQLRQRRRHREARCAGSTMQMIRVRRSIYRENRLYHFNRKYHPTIFSRFYFQNSANKQNRDASIEFYQANPACTHRLIPWVRREVIALFGCQDMNQVNRHISEILKGTP